ncbi:MAG: PAS domain S-box protein, partial [Candidatus Thermoplasmatota archaeon]|nr:PAS domain S-box protein [Candidatus Thermoplasmatota archaeon]
MLNDVGPSYVLHYVVFGFFLVIVLVDHRRILSFVTPGKEPDRLLLESKKKPVFVETKTVSPIYETSYVQPKIVTAADKISEVKEIPDNLLKNLQILFDDIQSKTKKLEALENEIEERSKKLFEQEKLFKDYIKSYVEPKEKVARSTKEIVVEIPSEDQILVEEEIKDNLIIDDKTDCVAITQRGVLKKVNNCFANLLGYQPEELVNKNLFVFIAPEGIEEVKKHYLNR